MWTVSGVLCTCERVSSLNADTQVSEGPLLLYLIGGPASGKSTLMRQLTRPYVRTVQAEPVPHEQLWRDGEVVGCELGMRRDTFSGTDALAMNVAPKVVRWLGTHPYPAVLGEGNRLGNVRFLMATMKSGYRVLVVHLDGDDAEYERRWVQREQKHSWAVGARTQARNVARQMSRSTTVLILPMTATPWDNVSRLRPFLP